MHFVKNTNSVSEAPKYTVVVQNCSAANMISYLQVSIDIFMTQKLAPPPAPYKVSEVLIGGEKRRRGLESIVHISTFILGLV